MNSIICTSFALVTLFAIEIPVTDKNQDKTSQHSKECPLKCTPCQNVIDKALGYLEKKLGEKDGLGQFNFRGLNAALCGLAFLSEGSRVDKGKYQTQVQFCLKWVIQDIQQMKVPPKEVGFKSVALTGFNVTRAFEAIFLSEICKSNHTDEIRSVLEKLMQFFKDGRYGDTKAWGYGFAGGIKLDKNMVSHNYPNMFSSHIVITAIAQMRDAGIKIDETVLEDGVNFLTKIRRSQGMYQGEFPYSGLLTANQTSPGTAGRTAGALYALIRAKKSMQSDLESSASLIKNKFKTDWKYTSDDSNFYNLMWLAVVMHCLGESTWKDFWSSSRDTFISGQKSDGSWDMKKPLNNVGYTFSTAISVLIMQLPAKNLMMLTLTLDDLKKIKK